MREAMPLLQPGERPDHIRAADGTPQHRTEHVEQEPDLGLGWLRNVWWLPVGRLVGQANVCTAAWLGQHEDES